MEGTVLENLTKFDFYKSKLWVILDHTD